MKEPKSRQKTTPHKGTRKENKDQSWNKRSHWAREQQKTTPKSAEHTMRSLNNEKSRNLGPKPITNSMKQLVQRDGRKTWKDTKHKRGFSCYHNCLSQDIDGLNFLKSRQHPLPTKWMLKKKKRKTSTPFHLIFA
jgi:hypothetical protein